jgi:cyclophilin family peptidyl-prolyl cis-trans isomerase
VLARVKEQYADQVRVVYRHFPLISIHDKAALSTQASEAAGAQGKFWEMHDLLFERQGEWAALSVEEFQAWVNERATELGLDEEQFTSDMLSEENEALALAAWDKGREIELPGTPFLLVDGKQIPADEFSITAVIELFQLKDKQFNECPPMDIDPSKAYFATLETEKGDIVLELFADQAPLAVNNFIFLANQGWYDNVTFHRVLEGFVAQSGDPTGTGFGGPGYAFMNEIVPELKFDEAGILAMANAGPDSNGSQFFITYGPAPQLDGGYTIFGRVLSGMEVVEDLKLRDPSQGSGLPPGDVILGISIEEK